MNDIEAFERDRSRLLAAKPDPTPNPMVKIHGKGPAGERCEYCAHLTYQDFSKRYYKCKLRGITRGPGTDHRVRWQACGKFHERLS